MIKNILAFLGGVYAVQFVYYLGKLYGKEEAINEQNGKTNSFMKSFNENREGIGR